jgi:hypothetical protein
MSNYRSTRYAKIKRARRREGIEAYYRHKEAAARISENENVFRPPRQSADAVVTIKIKGQPQMQFSSYKDPWGGWTISPTLAGKKVQQVLMRA